MSALIRNAIHRTHRAQRGAATLLALLAVAACGSSAPLEGHQLTPYDGSTMTGQFAVKPGDRLFFFLWAIDTTKGTQPIHFLKAEILGLPKGIAVDRVGAIKRSFKPIFQDDRGDQAAAEIEPQMRQVDEVTIRPTCPTGDGFACYGWYFAGELHILQPGLYVSTGIRITYEVGGKTYFQDYAHRIYATTDIEPPSLP